MATSLWTRFLKSLSRPAAPRRPQRVRLALESMEARLVPTVSPVVDGSGILQITTNDHDDVTILHQVTSLGPTTLVNGSQIADSRFNSIHIQGGFRNVNIVATSRPLLADDNDFITVGSANVDANGNLTPGSGNMQGILATLTLGTANIVNLDDSGDPTGKPNITLNVVNNVTQITNMAPAPITVAVQEGFLNRDVLGNLDLFGGRGRNGFNVVDTPAAFIFFGNVTTTNLFTGTAGDQVLVRGTHSAHLNIPGSGRDFVAFGDNGNLANIQSPVKVTNPPNFTGLEVLGSAASSAQNVTLSVANRAAPSTAWPRRTSPTTWATSASCSSKAAVTAATSGPCRTRSRTRASAAR